MDANPDMKKEGYELKKGDMIFIPFEKTEAQKAEEAKKAAEAERLKLYGPNDVRNRAIRVGVMLPLHNVDGDGRRMVEFYRGILMACDTLKKQGISTNVFAWNVPIDADIRQTLLEKNADNCDIIFGPLYTFVVVYFITMFLVTWGIFVLYYAYGSIKRNEMDRELQKKELANNTSNYTT